MTPGRPAASCARRRPARPGQRGAATVLVVALSGLLLVVGCGLAVVAALVVDHRRAQAAADLAALAGAASWADGGAACAAAARIAEANAATLVGCTTLAGAVEVRVRLAGPRWRGWSADLEARARAGPG
ncbi:hypothetical protein E8D34_13510 [Nocardioides sp. GY 10113]|uniref:Rv3654c family TadE-like protein n=1 Tax=Nocardioides sp. GY 10113 TaxID=2569761 RepID=UPI0010A776A3|nr:Rv3654c family TadE-like protein [Nocardioides sp. GY 10113]TIC85084.1 hypothetical protein E8D34_13510 [Nocardioides sp. GY 10113]